MSRLRTNMLHFERYNEPYFWEVVPDQKDDVQFLVYSDQNSDATVLSRLVFEPTSYNSEPLKEVNITVTNSNELAEFLRNHCSVQTYQIFLDPNENTADLREQIIRLEVEAFTRANVISIKYISSAIYESGEYCTRQFFYLVKVDVISDAIGYNLSHVISCEISDDVINDVMAEISSGLHVKCALKDVNVLENMQIVSVRFFYCLHKLIRIVSMDSTEVQEK